MKPQILFVRMSFAVAAKGFEKLIGAAYIGLNKRTRIIYGTIDVAHSLAEQPYGGDINIHPRLRPIAILRTFSNISHAELLKHIHEGERATWPLLARVRDQTCVSRALDAAIRRLSSSDTQ